MPDETQEIEPALTPDEWAAQSIHPFGDRSWVHIDTGPDRIEFGARDATGNVFEKYWIEDADDKFKLVALANAALPDDDPRKITHADIDCLGDVCYDGEGDYGRAMHILGKLRALLPPEET